MDFKFDPGQPHQLDAIQAVVRVFEGQPKSVAPAFDLIGTATAVANAELIPSSVLVRNIRAVQSEGGIPVLEDQGEAFISGASDATERAPGMSYPNLSVEMETGTGKTYIYIRAALELYQHYGFRKFVVVVPGVAVREGVLQAFRSLKTHLRGLFPAVPYRVSTYSANNLSAVRQFALSDAVEFMIMTLDSFNKSRNVIRRPTDRLQGETPLHLLQAARPILILDEPQNMESDQSVAALTSLAPLAALRFSATHRKSYALIHRLTPYDAYRAGLVKRIEVASVLADLDANRPYLRVTDISASGRTLTARAIVHQRLRSGSVAAKTVRLKLGSDLEAITGRSDYEGLRVEEINTVSGCVRFENGHEIALGEEWGADRDQLAREQLRYTVREHMLKQQRLRSRNIKVLTLFFIDEVARYQGQDAILRRLFAEAFEDFKGEFEDFRDKSANEVQAAYFAKRRTKQGEQFLNSGGESKEDEEAYRLIMENKEGLLDFNQPVSFIFSHSALREGWDNPNVFQICTLANAASEMRKRQEIGRGVRLCVDDSGSWVADESVNVLTVVANESYEVYVARLQAELREEFEGVDVPPPPPDARKRGTARLRKAALLSPEFSELWSRISARTKYTVSLDTEQLLDDIVPLVERVSLQAPKIHVQKAMVKVGEQDVLTSLAVTGRKVVGDVSAAAAQLPNMAQLVMDVLASSTHPVRLTRRTVIAAIARVAHVPNFLANPNATCVAIADSLRRAAYEQLVGGIRYEKTGTYYAMTGLLEEVQSWRDYMVASPGGLYDHVICDSQVEREFVSDLEARDDVKVYVKLPAWFKVSTPVGSYNPDWAIVIQDRDEHGDRREQLYLVRETKAVDDPWLLSDSERRKVQCAERHFRDTLGVDYRVVHSAKSLP